MYMVLGYKIMMNTFHSAKDQYLPCFPPSVCLLVCFSDDANLREYLKSLWWGFGCSSSVFVAWPCELCALVMSWDLKGESLPWLGKPLCTTQLQDFADPGSLNQSAIYIFFCFKQELCQEMFDQALLYVINNFLMDFLWDLIEKGKVCMGPWLCLKWMFVMDWLSWLILIPVSGV